MSKNFTAIKVVLFDCISSCILFLFRLSSKKKKRNWTTSARCALSHWKHSKVAFNLNGITRRNNLRLSCRPNDVVDDLLATLPAVTTGDQAASWAEAEAEAGVAVAARLQACTDWSGSCSSSSSRLAMPADKRHRSILSISSSTRTRHTR